MTLTTDQFDMALATLEAYSRIYFNLTQTGAFRHPENAPTAIAQLETIITDLTNHLFTNAKGQIS